MLITMVQEKQKKIEELMTTRKNLINKMTGAPQNTESNGYKTWEKPNRQRKKEMVQPLQKLGVP